MSASYQARFWEKPEIVVRFDRHVFDRYLFHPDTEGEEAVYETHCPSELKCDLDWQPEAYARMLFKDHWNIVRSQLLPLSPSKPCMVKGCPNTQTEAAWFNILGTVSNAYVCARHQAQFHGLCGEFFPWRPPSPAS